MRQRKRCAFCTDGCLACGSKGYVETEAPDPEPTARSTDPETSHAAARDTKPLSGRHRRMAYVELRRAGADGLTDFELADLTGVAQTSIGKRRKELVDAGYVEATDETRPAPSGSAARVWRAVSFQPASGIA